MDPFSPRRRLELVSAGGASRDLLRWLGDRLERLLPVEPTLGDPLPLADQWRDGEGAYRSGAVVDALLVRAEARGDPEGGAWFLAVAEAELTAPEVGRVFGEATVDGPCAVVGLAALRTPPCDEVVFRQRLASEAVHELGHLAGAEHCGDAQCVMYPSAHIADTDRKGIRLCRACRETVFRGADEANP